MAFRVFPLDNTPYEAKDFGAYHGTRTRGVFSADGQFDVTPGGGMNIIVSPGLLWFEVQDFYGASGLLDSAETLTVQMSDAILNRIDAVCLRINKLSNVPEVLIVQGAYAATPVPPTVQRTPDLEEIYVAYIKVNHGIVEITPDLIEDQRLNEDVCGLMRDGVTGIPTSVIWATADALIQQIRDALSGVLDGSEFLTKIEYGGSANGVVKDSDALGGVLAEEWSPINEGTFEYTQTVTGNTVTFQSRLGTPAFTPVNGIVQINAPIPANPVFIVDGNTVPAYLGDSTVSELPVGRWSSFVYDGTQINFKSGGAGLNYKIVGGTSQPTNPTENMIWVNTDVAITGYSFSSTQPTGAQGLLWVSTSNVSPVAFNALKKNALWVYPVGIRIYNLGAWVNFASSSSIYQAGGWKSFESVYFENGVFGSGLTSFTKWQTGVGSNNSVVGSSIDVKMTSATTTTHGGLYSNEIDLTGISTIIFTIARKWQLDNTRVGVYNGIPTSGNQFAAYVLVPDNTTYTEVMLDVSELNGLYRFNLKTQTWNGDYGFGITKIVGRA